MKRSIAEADQASRRAGSNDAGSSAAACRTGGVNAQWFVSDVASRSSMVAAGVGGEAQELVTVDDEHRATIAENGCPGKTRD